MNKRLIPKLAYLTFICLTIVLVGCDSPDTKKREENDTASTDQLPSLDLLSLDQKISKEATSKSTNTKAVDSITTTEQQRHERYLLAYDKYITALTQQAPKNELELLRLEQTQALREVANQATPLGKYYQAKLIYLQHGKPSIEEFTWYLKSAKEGYVPAFREAMLKSGSIETDCAWAIVQIHANAVAIESGAIDLIQGIGSNTTERHDWLHKCNADRLNQQLLTDDFRRAVLSETQKLIELISKFGYTYSDGTILSDPDLKIWKKEKIRITKSLGI